MLAGCGGAASPPTDPIAAPEGVRPVAPDTYAKPLGAAVASGPIRDDDAYRRAFASTFTSMTPENAMKWNALQPSRGDFTWGEAESLVDFARSLGMRVRGHPLVWDQQLPGWVAELPRDEVEEAMTTHVTEVMRRFRGRVAQWDVVNEPFEDDGSWTPNVFERALGPRYVEVALRAARRADPGAKLFVNEIAAERDGPKRRALLRLAARLQREGLLDGLGFQNHTTADDFPNGAQLAKLLDRVARLDLDVELTEVDVVLRRGTRAQQAEAWGAAARACAKQPRCTGFTAWGVTDRHSWLGADQEPLLFDAEGRAKRSLPVVQEALRR